jgi:hypothetical protein
VSCGAADYDNCSGPNGAGRCACDPMNVQSENATTCEFPSCNNPI